MVKYELNYALGVEFMDQTDKRILQVLQTDGKLQNNELAQRIGLSASPCLRRVKQLEEDGIIRAYVALVDPAKVNLRLTVFARIWLKVRIRKL